MIARFAVFEPLAIVLWIIAGNRLAGQRNRRIDAAACLIRMLAGVAALEGIDARLVQSVARVALLALFCWSTVCVARLARPRALAVSTMLVLAVALFAPELSMVEVPGIWFPFGVGVSRTQFGLALLVPLLGAFLYFRMSPPDSSSASRARSVHDMRD